MKSKASDHALIMARLVLAVATDLGESYTAIVAQCVVSQRVEGHQPMSADVWFLRRKVREYFGV